MMLRLWTDFPVGPMVVAGITGWGFNFHWA
jgi:hypothetical protein